jgi:hypothetical protein
MRGGVMDEELRASAERIIAESPELAGTLIELTMEELSLSTGERVSRADAREEVLRRVVDLLQMQLDLLAEHFTMEDVEVIYDEEFEVAVDPQTKAARAPKDVEKAVAERTHAEMARIYPQRFGKGESEN